MSWLSAIGGVVAAAFGASAISVGMASIVGGLVVGAAAGAIYTAFKDGNLLKNMAFGALGGAALGGIGAAAAGGGWVTASSTEVASATSSVYAAGGAAAGVNGAMGAASTTSGLLGGAAVGGSNLQGIGGLAGLGAAFLNGMDADKDRDAELKQKELDRAANLELGNKKIDADIAAAEMGATSSRENALTAAETAANQLEFAKDKFSKEFAEDTRRYNQERDDATKLRDDFRSSVVAGSQYASGAMPTIKPVEIKRQRMQLPQPSWITGNTQNQAQQVAQQPTPQPAHPQQPTGLLNQQQQVPA